MPSPSRARYSTSRCTLRGFTRPAFSTIAPSNDADAPVLYQLCGFRNGYIIDTVHTQLRLQPRDCQQLRAQGLALNEAATHEHVWRMIDEACDRSDS